MKPTEDPSVIFEQISAIQNKFNYPGSIIPEEELIAVVITAAPTGYVSILTAEQRAKGNSLALSDLEEVMTQQYRQVSGNNEGEETDPEFSLAAFSELVCYRCHKKGHKANACPDKGKTGANNRNRGRGKFSGKCNTCGKEGHKAADCWEDDKNSERRPKWYKQGGGAGNETAASGLDAGSSIEYLLTGAGMTFPETVKMLMNPNVFIGDTGATVHMTHSKLGAVKITKASAEDTVMMANGQWQESGCTRNH